MLPFQRNKIDTNVSMQSQFLRVRITTKFAIEFIATVGMSLLDPLTDESMLVVESGGEEALQSVWPAAHA
jgi:hypothetical protein